MCGKPFSRSDHLGLHLLKHKEMEENAKRFLNPPLGSSLFVSEDEGEEGEERGKELEGEGSQLVEEEEEEEDMPEAGVKSMLS